jgi:hypothetical protein
MARHRGRRIYGAQLRPPVAVPFNQAVPFIRNFLEMARKTSE